MKPLAFADYAVIAVFFAVMIGVGVYYSRRSKSSDQFFGNDKTVPWWLSGVSFYMNSFSALAFVMYSALAYKFGWVPVTVSWLSVPAVLLGAWFLAVRWRRAAKGSPIDYIAERYTPGMCRTLAILGLPMQLLDNALKLLAIGTVVGVGMGFPLFWSICISGLIIVLYTFLGGLKATLTCDFIQFLVILAVVFALPPLCLGRLAAVDGGSGLVHGFSVFLDKVPDGFFAFTNGQYTWVYMLVFFCCVGSTLSTNWSLVQRYYSTKSEGDAKKMAYLVAALLFVGPPLFFFPAMAARVFLPELDVNDAGAMNAVYATVCRHVLPAGMIGMVIAAMFSATMSSLAGNFNAAAAVMTNELYLKVAKNPSAKAKMVAARIATVLVGGLVVGLTFVMQYAQGADDLFNLSNKVFGVFLPPIAIPMLCGILVRRFSRRAGICGLVGGIAVGLAIFVAGSRPSLAFLREMVWIFPATSAATVAFLFAGTKFFPDSAEERAKVDAFMDRMSKGATAAAVALAAVLLSWGACAADFGHGLSGAKPWTGKPFLDDPQEFHFAVIGDLTGGERANVYANAVDKLNLLRPEFVMSVGDLVAGGGVPRAELKKQWDSFRKRTDKLEMPFFYVVGNHDIWTGFAGMSPGRQTSIDVWKEQFGTNTYYNFTYKGCHFVCLDSMERHDYYPPREPLPASQLAWASREIRRRANARWTFIFLHKPLDFTSDRWLKFEREIADVDYTVFCGDWHNHCTATRHGKKYHMVGTTGGGFDCGAAGDDLRYGIMDSITWVTVTKKGPVVSNLALSGIHGGTIQTCATTKGWIEAPLDYPSHLSEPPELYADEKNTALIPAEVMEGPGYDWHFRHAVILRQGRIYASGMEKFTPGKRRVVLLGDETASEATAVYPDAQVFDMGFKGDRTQNVIWRIIQGELSGYDPDEVMISVGMHNLGSNTGDEIKAALLRIVSLVRARAPRAKVTFLND